MRFFLVSCILVFSHSLFAKTASVTHSIEMLLQRTDRSFYSTGAKAKMQLIMNGEDNCQVIFQDNGYPCFYDRFFVVMNHGDFRNLILKLPATAGSLKNYQVLMDLDHGPMVRINILSNMVNPWYPEHFHWHENLILGEGASVVENIFTETTYVNFSLVH